MSARRGEAVVSVAVVTLFLLVRLTLLVVREPFFDELFTVWMAGKPFSGILGALRLDSGPPLYYFVARISDVFALRVLSLAFALAALLIVLRRQSLGRSRFVAGALLAAYPPAALFAVDARAYALCALFVTLGVVALLEQRSLFCAAAFLLAAYTHWYGALFLPLVLFSSRDRRRGLAAMATAGVLFLPGLWLAMQQPAQATAWLEKQPAYAPLNVFAFAGRYAEALFASAPWWVTVASTLAVLAALAAGLAERRRLRPPDDGIGKGAAAAPVLAAAVVVPVALAVLFALAGRTVYFPMRFESVVATPLVLWIAASLQSVGGRLKWGLVAILAGCGVAASVTGAIDHQSRPIDAYRAAAGVLRQNATPRDPIVASGYLYLEAVAQMSEARVRAYPAEQGRHPGWRVSGAPAEPLPAGGFIWIGERAAPELARIRAERPVLPLYANERAAIFRVGEALTSTLH